MQGGNTVYNHLFGPGIGGSTWEALNIVSAACAN